MLGVVFHWDHKDGLEAAGQKALYQTFDYTCRAFRADRVVIVDEGEVFGLGAPSGTAVVRSIEDALGLFDGVVPVYLSARATSTNLRHYIHPDDAVYIVGGDFSSLGVPLEADCVEIEYPGQEMELWASVVLGIALYDRSVKG